MSTLRSRGCRRLARWPLQQPASRYHTFCSRHASARRPARSRRLYLRHQPVADMQSAAHLAGCVPGSLCTRSCDTCSPVVSSTALMQEVERPIVPPLSGVRTRPLRELPPLAGCPRRSSAEVGAAPTDGTKAWHNSTSPAWNPGVRVPCARSAGMPCMWTQGGFCAAGAEPAPQHWSMSCQRVS